MVAVTSSIVADNQFFYKKSLLESVEAVKSGTSLTEFLKKYPEIGKKNPKSAFDILYKTEIGRIARVLDFSLKDTTTNVVNMLKFMFAGVAIGDEFAG